MRSISCVLGVVLCLFSGCAGDDAPAGVNYPQDVVLVILCTARADQFTGFGTSTDTTPYLYSQMRSGAVFQQTVAQAPWTKPASVAVLTGQHPASVGMVEPKPGRNDRALTPAATLLSERLQHEGFQTVGATANPNLNGHFGFNQGFDDYIETSPLMREGGVKVLARGVADALYQSIRQRDSTRPMYVQVMLVDAHRPFNVKARHHREADNTYPVEVRQYRSALRQLDDGFSALQQTLISARPGLAEALWVVVGDHGEGLSYPKHHGTSHGTTLYPSVTHVPLGMWGADISENTSVSGLAAQVDVVPTVLGLLNLPTDDTLKGVDFSSLLRKGGGESPRREVYTSTWFRWAKRVARYDSEGMCQKDFNVEGTRRQLSKAKPTQGLYAFPDGCFDSEKDPALVTPILNTEKQTMIERWYQGRVLENQQWDHKIDSEIPSGIDAQLKALGYAE